MVLNYYSVLQRFVLSYRYRAANSREYNEDVLKAAMYYNAMSCNVVCCVAMRCTVAQYDVMQNKTMQCGVM